MSTPRIRRIILDVVVVALPLLGSTSLVVLICQSIRVSLDAEVTLHAYELVLDVLDDYLAQNGGRWPRSWDDLIQIRHDGFAGRRWPEDVAQVKKRIRIDFDLTTDEVIGMDIEHFTAVTQIGPNYGPHEGFLAKFLYDARRSAGRVPGPEVRKGDAPAWFKDIERAQQAR